MSSEKNGPTNDGFEEKSEIKNNVSPEDKFEEESEIKISQPTLQKKKSNAGQTLPATFPQKHYSD